MSDISVIICSRNPRTDYLRRVLEALRAQTLPYKNWELLVVDNASDQKLSNAWDLSWHPGARHVREETLGLTSARLRGISESCGDLVVFVDDDNVLSADFLSRALSVVARHPHLAVFGAGVLEPEFEIAPPAELLPRVRLLTLRTVAAPMWSNNPIDYFCLPMGAGLCVTQAVAKAFRQLVGLLGVPEVIGRRGSSLFSGDDDLFSWAASRSGQGFGVFPELRVTHLIAANRLEHKYFLRLTHDHTFSHGVLRYLLTGATPQRTGWRDRARVVAHGLTHGTFSMQCQWATRRGNENAARFVEERDLRPLPEWVSAAPLLEPGSPPRRSSASRLRFLAVALAAQGLQFLSSTSAPLS